MESISDIRVTRKELASADNGELIDAVVHRPRLSVMSYNIDGSADYVQERCRYIVKLVREQMPDIIGLTGCTALSMQHLADLRTLYSLFQVGSDLSVYMSQTTIELCKTSEPYYYEIFGNGQLIGAKMTHLASNHTFDFLLTRLDANDAFTREKQVQDISQVIASMDEIILCGDFPIVDPIEDAERLLRNQLQDAWLMAGSLLGLRDTGHGRQTRLYYHGEFSLRSFYLLGLDRISGIGCPPSSNACLNVSFTINSLP